MSPHAKAPKVAPALRHKPRGGTAARAFVAFVLAAVAAIALPAMAQAVTYQNATGSPFSTNVANSNGVGGVAVNQTNDEVYAGTPTVGGGPDPGIVTRHTAAGVFQNQFGSGGFYGGVAVDPVTQNVYAFNGLSAIEIYTAAGVATGTPIAVTADLSDSIPDIFNQIATDAAGNVYYPNQADDTVQKFSPAGALLLTISGGFSDPSSVAVDSAGNVYVVDGAAFGDTTNGRLQKFDATGAAASCPATLCQNSGILSVGTNPAATDVFVGKAAGTAFHIERYNAAGTMLADFGLGDFNGSAGGLFIHHQIAVNSDTGRVYAGDSNGSVRMYDEVPPVVPVADATAASPVGKTTATLNGTVDPDGSTITDCHFEYVDDAEFQANGFTNATDAACSPATPAGSDPVAVSASITSLTPDTTYHVRLSASSADGTDTDDGPTFDTLPPTPPDAVTGTPSANPIGSTTATLRGTVDPNGVLVSAANCEFEYVDDAEFDLNGFTNATSANCATAPGAGNDPVNVSVNVSSLTPNTEYHVRLSATNADGSDTGADVPFTTSPNPSPDVVTSAASNVDTDSATLNGTVDPNGTATSDCHFEWGTTTAYGNTAPCASNPGSGGSPVAVSANITGLSPNTEYHYKLVATNGGGTDEGLDEQFNTDEPDTDGDGVSDSIDQCDSQPGPASNNGCPVPPPNPDTDDDGVLNASDKCPMVKGPASNNGCPVTPPPPAGTLALASKIAVYKSGKASVKIKCTGGPCKAGKITLKAKIKSGKKKAKTVKIGSASIKALASGGKATIKVKLSGKAKSALAKTGKLKATVSGAVKGKVTIKGGKKKKKK